MRLHRTSGLRSAAPRSRNRGDANRAASTDPTGKTRRSPKYWTAQQSVPGEIRPGFAVTRRTSVDSWLTVDPIRITRFRPNIAQSHTCVHLGFYDSRPIEINSEAKSPCATLVHRHRIDHFGDCAVDHRPNPGICLRIRVFTHSFSAAAVQLLRDPPFKNSDHTHPTER